MKIAFIGLGNMGAPMARNLLKAGHAQLSVFDLNAQAVQSLVEAGATAAASPKEAVAGATMSAKPFFNTSLSNSLVQKNRHRR